MAPVSVCIGQKVGSCTICNFPILGYGIIPTQEDAGMFRMDHDFMWGNVSGERMSDWFFRLFHNPDDF